MRPLGASDEIEGSARLKRAHTLLEETQRVAGVGTYVFDAQTGEVELSDELLRIGGLDPSRPLSTGVTRSLLHPDDRERFLAWAGQVARGEPAGALIARIVRPDGEIRHLESRARRLELDGRPMVVGVSTDVTARVALEEQLRHAAKMDAVGVMAAGVAHDVNNYVTVIGMQLEMLRRQVPASAMGLIDGVQHATDQCAALTGQLLSLARRQPTAIRVLDLGELVRRVVSVLERLVGANTQVLVSVASAGVCVEGDPAQLESLLVNLATNARDAMPDGGQLLVTLETPGLDGTAPREAVLIVRDTGRGIAPLDLPRVFEPYFTTKPVGRGTGLGLASAYATARQHGGAIEVASELGVGTTFTIRLPLCHRGAPATEAARPTPMPQPARQVALVVEDLEPLRGVVTKMLQAMGLEVLAAANGLEALELLTRDAPPIDVVLSDLLMPRMGGVELARALRERGITVGLVFMSGYADQGMLDELATLAPSAPVLAKPFSTEELQRTIEEALGARTH